MTRRRPRHALLLGFFITVALAFLCPGALFGGETFVERDLLGYYRPAKWLLAPLARASGGLPLWNPFFASGQPFAANPEHELFHPMTALFFVLPFEWAFRLQVLVPLIVAAFSMSFFLLTLRRSRSAALFGGLGWALGGYTLSVTNVLPTLFNIAVLPALLGFTVLLARGRGGSTPADDSVTSVASSRAGSPARWVVGVGLAFGLMCLAGEPSTILATPAFLVAVLVHEWLPVRPRPLSSRVAAISSVGVGLLLGLLLGAPVLLPGLHLTKKTARREPLTADDAGSWSMPKSRLFELAAPPIPVGARRVETNLKGYADRVQPYIFSIYPGALVALLAGVAWARKPGRIHLWLALAAVGIALAAGDYLPFWKWVRLLPFFSSLRYPEKFVMLPAFALVVASSAGLDDVLARRRGRWLLLFVPLLGIAAGAAWVWGATDGARLAVPALTMAGGVGIMAAWAGDPGRRGTLMAALTGVELVSVGHWLVPTKPVETVMTPPPVIREIYQKRVSGPVFHLAAASSRRQVTIPFIATPPLPVLWGIPLALDTDYDLTELIWSRRAKQLFFAAAARQPSLMPALLARRGVGATIRFRPFVRQGPLGPEWPRESGSPVEVVVPAVPSRFAFCASAVERVDGEKGWYEAVLRLGKAVASTACVDLAEKDVPTRVSPGDARIVERTPVRLVLDVAGSGPDASFVAINQTWDEGWRATVDARPARVVRADISLSGVVVPPGRHRVELSYSDPRVTVGASLFGVTLLGCLLTWTFGARRLRYNRPTTERRAAWTSP